MRKPEFTLDTFAKMLKQTRKLGPLGNIMKMLPGMGGMADALKDTDAEGEMRQLLGLIDSMTLAERHAPIKLINTSRRRRIAAGAGVEPHQVNELVKQFDAMSAMMKELPNTGTDRYSDG